MYEVEPGFELPKVERPRKKTFTYPFRATPIGESFLIELEPVHFELLAGKSYSYDDLVVARVAAEAKRFREVVNPEFRHKTRKRTLEKHGECGRRVWRIK